MIILNNDGINTIFSSLNGSRRILHLYTSTVDKYAIHKTFFSRNNGKTVYVSNDDPKIVKKKLHKPELTVILPKNMGGLPSCKTVILDGESITEEEEFKKCISQLSLGQAILCTFDLSKLNSRRIKELTKEYDKLILTTDSTTVVSSKSLSKKNFSNKKIVDEFVKKELKTIVLAFLLGKPMCGTDIKKKIFERFNILLSSGTLYPLLHELEEKELLTCHYGVKTKTYEPTNKKKIESILNEHMEAKNFLNDFLQKAISKGG
ncbi:MAG: helix-turn-helix transcriptional regulator [Nanoarchaeota archaeon]|nr:helix-turn-helix transcriptional regulator [Nanoarchaeota archaeon]